MNWTWLDWAAVALLGGVVGASELISRYKDHPGAAIKSWPAIFYIAINCAASVGALGPIHAYGWFGQSRGTVQAASSRSSSLPPTGRWTANGLVYAPMPWLM